MHFTEKRLQEYFVDLVLRDSDKSITVRGDDEYDDVRKSREHFTVLDNMGQCDSDVVRVWSNELNKYVGWFWFVYGNVTNTSEAIEVISDYSANEYADKIVNQLEEMTQ